ncbi:MAG TPA: hypothetical protein VN253_11020 [Kofleriaceae bacterium]|nr:hypothetical protein [Kofleriaceae bacterium]
MTTARALMLIGLIGCETAAPSPFEGELKISKSTPLEFEATYVSSTNDWVHVHQIMGLTATKALLDSSSGKIYKNDGLGLADMGRPIGDFQLEPGSVDEAMIRELLENLIAAGINPRASEVERATPQYAAAYTAVEVLGIEKIRAAYGDTRPAESEEEPTVFPYYGWTERTVPVEAYAAIGGEQNGSGICGAANVSYCCGSFDCYWCDPNNTNNHGWCAPACAAGDHCNHYHATSPNHCGAITCPGCGDPGDKRCPHTCSLGGTDNAAERDAYNRVGNVCSQYGVLPWELAYCYLHTPEGHPWNYACEDWH